MVAEFYRAIILSSIISLPFVFTSQSPRNQISIQWITEPTVAVEVTGLSANTLARLKRAKWTLPQWQSLFSIYTEQGGETVKAKLPPITGAYRVTAERLRFEPQFPFEPGIRYRAVFNQNRLADKRRSEQISSVFNAPRLSAAPTTEVTQIFPSAGLLPENLLKFYLHFSASMSRGRIYDYIKLFDESGKQIELPFLEIDEELWDPELKRLTLFIDPGRIKRGVKPLEDIGPSLEAGQSYTLVIDRDWKDSSGQPLKSPFKKTFKVGPPDRRPPDPAEWKIESSSADSRAPLTIIFPEPMEHALAERVIFVTLESGEQVNGKAVLEDQERRWLFTPNQPWQRGKYQLLIQTTLEDLAGNNIGKPFEVDLFEGVQRRLSTPSIKIPFEIR